MWWRGMGTIIPTKYDLSKFWCCELCSYETHLDLYLCAHPQSNDPGTPLLQILWSSVAMDRTRKTSDLRTTYRKHHE